MRVARGPVYVGGRYRKLARDISHSPWLPGKAVTSVEVISPMHPCLRCLTRRIPRVQTRGDDSKYFKMYFESVHLLELSKHVGAACYL